jgi:cytochrome P450
MNITLIRSSVDSYFARFENPVRVQIFTWEFHIVQGTENVQSLLGNTSTSNTIFNAAFLRKVCDMSKKAVARFEDASEWTPAYHDRKNYLDAAPLYTWSSAVIHKYLTGKSALQLSRRFEKNLMQRIGASAVSSTEGVVLDDFIDYFAVHVTSALVDSLCGKGLIERNPSFPKAFWAVCENFSTYMKGYPQIIAPQAFKARSEALAAIKDWQNWAAEHYDAETTPVNEDGDDEFWGSKFFRERYSTFVYDMGFDPADMASNELGFLFGATANATVNTYWCTIEVFRNASLLKDVRKEVQACKTGGTGELQFDVTRLLQQPLLQAVFTENLRLRCHNMFLRRTCADIKILDWFIPKNKLAIAWSTPRHTDPTVWSSMEGARPVTEFWPSRFLRPGDEPGLSRFTFAGTEGSWLPFGSGANICPGMQFANIHCILTVAMMVESLDCDILAPAKNLQLDMSKFGMGVMGPKGKVPVRIRKRTSVKT